MLRYRLSLLLTLFFPSLLSGQLYFPPTSGTTWETATPSAIGWDETRLDSLRDWLTETNTKAFIVLYRGRIVIEWYLNGHTQDANFQWASAGKTITALAIGMAQEEGLLNINDPANQYMGDGWTSATQAQEDAITIWHQLTMTNGLEDNQLLVDPFCTDKACLLYRAAAGTRWAYHNAPYTLLDSVIEKASGESLNAFISNRIRNPLGMNGLYLKVGFNNVYFSTARSMARFGLMMQAGGVWNGDTLLHDRAYFAALTTPSQDINKSYGYLWWLNGQQSYRVPQSQIQFPGPYAPAAPPDLVAGIGQDGQILALIPSQELVVVRQGDNPGDGSPAPISYVDSIWRRVNYVQLATANETPQAEAKPYRLYPNPSVDVVTLAADGPSRSLSAELHTTAGACVEAWANPGTYSVAHLPRGLYVLTVTEGTRRWAERLLLAPNR
ncbi:MAG: serine hydrolase [Bacteroidia bacterium]|nr:serine hydrolase [Bacteroidia bacterium]